MHMFYAVALAVAAAMLAAPVEAGCTMATSFTTQEALSAPFTSPGIPTAMAGTDFNKVFVAYTMGGYTTAIYSYEFKVVPPSNFSTSRTIFMKYGNDARNTQLNGTLITNSLVLNEITSLTYDANSNSLYALGGSYLWFVNVGTGATGLLANDTRFMGARISTDGNSRVFLATSKCVTMLGANDAKLRKVIGNCSRNAPEGRLWPVGTRVTASHPLPPLTSAARSIDGQPGFIIHSANSGAVFFSNFNGSVTVIYSALKGRPGSRIASTGAHNFALFSQSGCSCDFATTDETGSVTSIVKSQTFFGPGLVCKSGSSTALFGVFPSSSTFPGRYVLVYNNSLSSTLRFVALYNCDDQFGPTGPPSDPDAEPDGGRRSHFAIVTGVIGGALLLIIGLSVTVCCLYRKRRLAQRFEKERRAAKLAAYREAQQLATSSSVDEDASQPELAAIGHSGEGFSISYSSDGNSNFFSPSSAASMSAETRLERIKAAIDTHNYARGKVLGRGVTGTVYEALLRDGITIAVKEVQLQVIDHRTSQRQVEKIRREAALLEEFRHENLLTCFGVQFDEEEFCVRIYLEIIASGTLLDMVNSLTERIDESVVKKYVRQILSALAYIHERGVVHRDLKCANILCDGTTGLIKLADFGTAKWVGVTPGASRAAMTMTGTPFFMAPEVLVSSDWVDDEDDIGAGYGTKADIWSLGITILEMVNGGAMPWPKFHNLAAAFMHIASAEGVPLIPEYISGPCADFVRACTQRDPRMRQSAVELLNHEWLRA